MKTLHMEWHWTWARIWASAHWYGRAAWHLDRWFVLVATALELHTIHPNFERRSCRLIGAPGETVSWAQRR